MKIDASCEYLKLSKKWNTVRALAPKYPECEKAKIYA